jgi:hypothetical protein
MTSNSDARKAVVEILRCLKRIFGQYSRTARERAWKSVLSKPTEREIRSLLNNPSKPLISPERFATFKEWFNQNT